jgi:hypothetical protein
MSTPTLSPGDRLIVEDVDGIVFYFKAHPVAQDECQGHPCTDAADFYPHAGIGEVFFCDGSCEDITADTDRAIVVMVGDDREHIVYIDEITPLDDDEHVCSCGQRGCPHE